MKGSAIEQACLQEKKEQACFLFEQHKARLKRKGAPASASWLNTVEGWFGQLERRALHRGVFASVGELKTAIRRSIKIHNEKLAKPFGWYKSTESIMTSVTQEKLSAINVKEGLTNA